jgi:hypothetical protein
MNSFDVFDTLIARRYVNNNIILNHIESEFKLSGFVTARITADSGSRSLQEIYDVLVNENVIPVSIAAEVMNREITLEIETAIPVKENIDRVNDGDLLISDMYLPAYAIREMVRYAGLTKQVTIHQSNGDKNSGKIWKALQNNKPKLHLGDNLHSDVTSAKQYGINAEHYPGTHLNSIEQHIYNNGLSQVALLSREIRIRNGKVSSFFNVANSLNLPWLFVTAEMIHRKHNDSNIVFLGRDCQLLQRIYSSYYNTSTYLPFSRKVAFNQPAEALKYLSIHSPKNSVLVDIISTGATWEHLAKFGNTNITAIIYSNIDGNRYTVDKPILPARFDYLTKNDEVLSSGLLLEVMNCAEHGHLSSINEIAPNVFVSEFGEPELSTYIINEIHSPVQKAIDIKMYYQSAIREELKNIPDETLKNLFILLVQNICNQSMLNQHLGDFYAKENNYLNSIKLQGNK